METVLSVFFLFLFIVIIISLTCFTIKYIFDGFGLMEMAKTKNEKYPWLAWIPWAREFLRGKLAYDTDHGAAIYLGATIGVSLITYVISFIAGLISKFSYEFVVAYVFIFIIRMGYSVVYYITQYKIFNKFSKNSTIMIVFTIVTKGFLAPIFNFAIRNNKLENKNNIQ